jgi:carbamoyltransferase
MNKYVIGIHCGHNATVAVAKSGEIIFCQSEERLNRIKNSTGFPRQTLEYVYKNICKPKEVDTVEIFQKSLLGYIFLKKYNFKPFQYGQYLSTELEKKNSGFRTTKLYWLLSQFKAKYLTENNKNLKKEALNYYSKEARINTNKINFIDHHTSHAYSAIANIKEWKEALIFTLDGVGDYKCASVNIFKNGHLKTIQTTDHYNSLGYFYSSITELLGMRSGEHEFKVMGLAPYSNINYYLPILKKLKKLIILNSDGNFEAKNSPIKLNKSLGDIIRHQRFDNIAGAIQALTEELTISWINFWIKKKNIKNIAVSGGVFMNVKVCQKVLENCKINKYFIVPSAADESTAIGAAFYGSMRTHKLSSLTPLKDLYLGMQFNDNEIQNYLINNKIANRYEIHKPQNINKEIANLLSQNKIVARFYGRMEFGARALGNRSILANPSDFSIVEEINSKIKIRDFWMPFTPSIIEDDINNYIINNKNIFCPYMVLTFNTTMLAQKHLKAAIHPRDKTIRPQCVVKTWNPNYYEIIKEFKKKTGIGAVLNTSFNLSGEPNVCSPKDAIHTMDNSDLKYLAIGSFLLEKKIYKNKI